MRYTAWYSGLLPLLDGGVAGPFDRLAALMRQPTPPPADVAREAGTGAKMLSDLMPRVDRKYDQAAVRALLGKLAARRDVVPKMTWDEMEQLVLAVAALHQADRALAGQQAKPEDKDEVTNRLRSLFQGLAFPRGYESPAQVWTDKKVRTEVQALLDQLSRK
jgi:hypothetical protein